MSQGQSCLVHLSFFLSHPLQKNRTRSYRSCRVHSIASAPHPLASSHLQQLVRLYPFLLSSWLYISLEPRRAAVAIVIRIVPSPTTLPPADASIPTLGQFFDLDWVKDSAARPEILFLQRDGGSSSDGLNTSLSGEDSTHRSSSVEAHLAFPGGRMEEGDEGGLYTGTSTLVHQPAVIVSPPDTQPCGKHGKKSVWISRSATLHALDNLMTGKLPLLWENGYS